MGLLAKPLLEMPAFPCFDLLHVWYDLSGLWEHLIQQDGERSSVWSQSRVWKNFSHGLYLRASLWWCSQVAKPFWPVICSIVGNLTFIHDIHRLVSVSWGVKQLVPFVPIRDASRFAPLLMATILSSTGPLSSSLMKRVLHHSVAMPVTCASRCQTLQAIVNYTPSWYDRTTTNHGGDPYSHAVAMA